MLFLYSISDAKFQVFSGKYWETEKSKSALYIVKYDVSWGWPGWEKGNEMQHKSAQFSLIFREKWTKTWFKKPQTQQEQKNSTEAPPVGPTFPPNIDFSLILRSQMGSQILVWKPMFRHCGRLLGSPARLVSIFLNFGSILASFGLPPRSILVDFALILVAKGSYPPLPHQPSKSKGGGRWSRLCRLN